MQQLTRYPSIDKPWLKYYCEEAINAPLPQCTVYENIYQHNKEHLNKTALEYFGLKINYKKMFRQVDDCAKALVANGVHLGSIITICSSGIPEVVYLLLACSKIGAIANFVNPLFETQQKIDRINDTNSHILFVMDKMFSYVKSIIPHINIKKVVIIPADNALPNVIRTIIGLKDCQNPGMKADLKSGKYILWNDYINNSNKHYPVIKAQYHVDMPLIIVYSSGTTGACKGIILTNDGINATIVQYETGLFSREKGKSFLHNVPIWFSTGVSISLLMPLCLGVSCILEPFFSAESFCKDIIKYRPNYTLVSAGLWSYAMEHLQKKIDLSFLLCPITGGEQMLRSTECRINDFLKKHGCNCKIQNGWGMCELGATVATSVFLNNNKSESVGVPLPLVVISAFDVDSGEEVPCNVRGELRVQTPCKMKEYYNNPSATKEFFKADRSGNIWGCTGDIGYVDEDGFIFVLGRASNYFIAPDGIKHYLFDIENVINQNDNIETCEVVTINSKNYGREVPTAHIILNKDFSSDKYALISELDTRCKEKLPEYAVPVGYKFRKSFAIKPSGKRDTLPLKSEHDEFWCIINGEVKCVSIE